MNLALRVPAPRALSPWAGMARMQSLVYGEGGIRTLDGDIHPHNALAGRRLQPLGHFSGTTMVSQGPAATPDGWRSLVCSGRGEVSERPKERDWKSRTRRKAGRGFKSRPLRLDLSLVRGTRNITLRGHVTSPAPRHAEQAGTPLTYPTGIGRRPLCAGVFRSGLSRGRGRSARPDA